MNDGEVFKKIRNSRGISQKDIVKNNLSRTTISKFENNKIMLSMNNFNYLLNSIDVSFEEFNFIKNNYSYNDKEQIIYLFNQIFSNSDFTYIDALINLCNNYLKNNFSKSIKCIYNTLYVLKYSFSHDLTYVAYHANEVWKELSKIDSWTILDIKIINCCLHFFDPDTYDLISNQLLRSLNKYKSFINIKLLESSIFLNLTLLFILQKNRTQAEFFSIQAKESAYQSKRLDYIAISLVRHGLIFKKKDDVNMGLSMIRFLSNDELEYSIQEEIKNFSM